MGEQILLYYLKVFKNLILVLFIIFSFFIIYVLNKNIELNKNQFEVYKGSTITEVIEKNFTRFNSLEKIIFKFTYILNELVYDKTIHYGNFSVNDNITYLDFLNVISKPSNILNKITIVEGWTKEDLNKELYKHFKKNINIEYTDILADTYYFDNYSSIEDFYDKILKFKKNYFQNKRLNNSSLIFNNDEIIIIGSLIEKEGLDYYDKKKISSVIMNRLKKNMKLQIDATVIYSLTNGNFKLNRSLKLKDLKINHPFNTYKYKGLPPKPISFVGTKTIDIIFEDYNTEYLFYFFNNSLRKHIFSKNYEDHKKKLNDYRSTK